MEMANQPISKSRNMPLSVQWKGRLGHRGVFAIQTNANRSEDPEAVETLMTLTAEQAIALGGILIKEGNERLKAIRNAGS